MEDATTMAISGAAGFVFRHISELTKAAAADRIKGHELHEASKEAASKRKGGTWMRRALYILVAIGFLSILFATYFGQGVTLEYQLDRNFLGLFKWQAVKLKEVAGVVFVQENRTAFLALLSFYCGQGVK